MSIYDFEVKDSKGEDVSLSKYKDKVIIVVNTASACGYTPQYKDLQALYEEYKEEGLVILGFPCNQFMNQEPGSNEEIKSFCELNFGVTFPVF
jgi:glutathione peroxidase